jgi:hypothetical protein
MANTITSRLEEQGLEAARREFERHKVEIASEATWIGRLENMVRRHPSYAMLAGMGLGLGLGLLLRGLARSRD